MGTIGVFRWVNLHQRAIHLYMAPILLLLVSGVTIMVYATGGIKFVYSHSMYIPIVLAGIVYGVKGGILIALLGGLALGPFMPIDVRTGELQQTINWLYRTGFFLMIGLLSGAASDAVRSYLRHLVWVSRNDISTQLPNRMALLDDLQTIGDKQNTTEPNILLVLSLQSTTELKAAFGFEVIETIIKQTAYRFNTILANRAKLYRAGTEEVSALISGTNIEKISLLLSELNNTSRHPFLFEGIPIHIDSRMGYVALYAITDEPELYLQQAESALNAAHENLHDFVEYQPSLKLATRDNMTILGELMKGIKQEQLSLHYQAKIDITTGNICGVEALIRWKHPKRGNIPAAAFIPRAEQSTLIHLVTRFVLEQAIKQVLHWQKIDIHLPIAVNISPYNLCQPGFSDLVLQLLEEHGLSGQSLELEMTEGALVKDMDRTITELVRLSDAGITIAVDDFGTGYSSLQYLHKLPISHLKIDQSFVRRLPTDKDAIHILEASISLAHKMNMKAVAEGVEDLVVLNFLRDIGCDIAQGYFISRPLPKDNFTKWYSDNNGCFDIP